jgi:hypothetical protein
VDLETYQQLAKGFPKEIDWNIDEATDMTEGAQQLACVSGVCEV